MRTLSFEAGEDDLLARASRNAASLVDLAFLPPGIVRSIRRGSPAGRAPKPRNSGVFREISEDTAKAGTGWRRERNCGRTLFVRRETGRW
jgi:hypothetical protein